MIRSLFTFFIAVYLMLPLLCEAQNLCMCDSHTNTPSATLEKVYILPEQIAITAEGKMFALIDEEFIQITQLNCDEEGLFLNDAGMGGATIEPRKPSTWCGHPVYHHACGRCGILFCPCNCKCFD